ncbi:hypothetical protein [Pseudogracilibacillus sp. SO30301A]|uniref:hypothetical protein n=1 Tax=Pseudogracilibacillus sp. SO30301A TaxID=3098291 RepID=UPI00300E04F8
MTKIFQCNRCGRSHKHDPDDFGDFTGNLFHRLQTVFGYSSPFDGDLLEFNVCELCLFEILRDFKYRPILDGEDPVKAFDAFRTKETPYYDDFFIKNYNELENCNKK